MKHPFLEQLDEQDTPCRGRWHLYTDYTDKAEEDDGLPPAPTDKQAEALCAACPLAALCGKFAEDTGQSWGVWGGQVRVPSRDGGGRWRQVSLPSTTRE